MPYDPQLRAIPTFPRPKDRLVDANGIATTEFKNFLQQLEDTLKRLKAAADLVEP